MTFIVRSFDLVSEEYVNCIDLRSRMAPRQSRNIVEENEILQVSKYELENCMVTILSPVASGWGRCCRKISREMTLNLSWRTEQSFAGSWTKFSQTASRSFERRWHICLLELETNLREFEFVQSQATPGVQIRWSNSWCCLHTSAALQLQLFASDLPVNQSDYTADTLSSNQNRVDYRKWNFIVTFTLTHL